MIAAGKCNEAMRSSRSQIWSQTAQPAGGVSPKNITIKHLSDSWNRTYFALFDRTVSYLAILPRHVLYVVCHPKKRRKFGSASSPDWGLDIAERATARAWLKFFIEASLMRGRSLGWRILRGFHKPFLECSSAGAKSTWVTLLDSRTMSMQLLNINWDTVLYPMCCVCVCSHLACVAKKYVWLYYLLVRSSPAACYSMVTSIR